MELAMLEEIKALHAYDTRDLVDLPKDRKAIPDHWVQKIKSVDGKARLAAKGYVQILFGHQAKCETLPNQGSLHQH